jgi:hypothetical protein
MHLVTATALTPRNFARLGMVEKVRDVGRTLEYVLARYDRLVREVAGTDLPSPDFEGRVQQASRQVADVATRLQDLLVLEHEARRAEAYAAFEQVAATPRSRKPGSVVAARRPRRTTVDGFSHIVTVPPVRERAVVQ